MSAGAKIFGGNMIMQFDTEIRESQYANFPR